mmetsp:Transcript_11549/g.27174  ORF Transcript_11549/g.27174 Transcript_11549/m.27174 type:complete len:214 (-) Transcript_11549:369-1010(-)
MDRSQLRHFIHTPPRPALSAPWASACSRRRRSSASDRTASRRRRSRSARSSALATASATSASAFEVMPSSRPRSRCSASCWAAARLRAMWPSAHARRSAPCSAAVSRAASSAACRAATTLPPPVNSELSCDRRPSPPPSSSTDATRLPALTSFSSLSTVWRRRCSALRASRWRWLTSPPKEAKPLRASVASPRSHASSAAALPPSSPSRATSS